jgi:hypothetical protein
MNAYIIPRFKTIQSLNYSRIADHMCQNVEFGVDFGPIFELLFPGEVDPLSRFDLRSNNWFLDRWVL